MKTALLCCALCATAVPAAADTTLYRCLDERGVLMLSDRPCSARPSATSAPAIVAAALPLPAAPDVPPRRMPARPPLVNTPSQIDVSTMAAARRAMLLQDQVASAR